MFTTCKVDTSVVLKTGIWHCADWLKSVHSFLAGVAQDGAQPLSAEPSSTPETQQPGGHSPLSASI